MPTSRVERVSAGVAERLRDGVPSIGVLLFVVVVAGLLGAARGE